MASPVIYGPALSTYVRTARLVCEEKDADYRLVEIDILKGGHKTPEHLARHPFGRVPAFEHDGFRLYETSAITRYLDAILPGTPLTPADPKGTARMQQAVAIIDAYGYGAMISACVIQRVVVPMTGGTTDETVIAAALPTAQISLGAFEELLGDHAWLAGDVLSLADLHVAPVMAYLSSTPEGQRLLPEHPKLTRWWTAMSSRPSMAKTQPQPERSGCRSTSVLSAGHHVSPRYFRWRGRAPRGRPRQGTGSQGSPDRRGAAGHGQVGQEPRRLADRVFDGFRAALAANRAQFFLDVPSGPFYGYNRQGAKVSEGVIRNWWRRGMMGGAIAHYECIKAFSETNFTEDLKQIGVPVLFMHGDDDQIVPIADSALLAVKLVKSGTLKVYEGLPHGMCTTHPEIISPDLLAFIRG